MRLCTLTISAVSLALALFVRADDICDFTCNPEARDGHTPADPSRFFTVCASSRFEAHPSSVMLPDGKTMLAFWDVQQAGPCGPAALSTDAGRTWIRIDEKLPKEFATWHDEPKAWRFVDPKTGKVRIRVFASYGTAGEYDWRGADDRPLAEAMPSILSEDEGATWKPVPPLGPDFACVVGFSGMVQLKDGAYLGVFSRGANPNGEGSEYRVMGSYSRDGGLTWEKPFVIAEKKDCRFLLPTVFRSPDGKELCCIVGDDRKRPDWEGVHGAVAWMCRSKDEGQTWSEPGWTIQDVSGSEHSVGTLADGRLVVAFRQKTQLLGWIGTYEALCKAPGAAKGRVARLIHNYGDNRAAGAPNVHVRPDGEVVVVAHSQLDLHRPMPAVVAMRFEPDEIQRILQERELARKDFEGWNPFAGTSFRPLDCVKLYGPFAQESVMKDKKERTLIPFDGTQAYIAKADGAKPTEVVSTNGSYDVALHANRRRGNAAILVWTVRVPSDCTTRLRLVGSPTASCFVGGKQALPPVCAGIFSSRTTEISLKKGDNEISVMVYQPQDRASASNPSAGLPMRVAAALELQDFTCPRTQKKIEFQEEEQSLDDMIDL